LKPSLFDQNMLQALCKRVVRSLREVMQELSTAALHAMDSLDVDALGAADLPQPAARLVQVAALDQGIGRFRQQDAACWKQEAGVLSASRGRS